MKKKPVKSQQPPKQLLSLAIKERLIDALKVGLSHPVTVGLMIMTGAVIGQIALKKSENEGSQLAKDINFQLGGLYSGAQGIATAAVVAPVIMQGLQAAGSAASAYFAPVSTGGAKPPT